MQTSPRHPTMCEVRCVMLRVVPIDFKRQVARDRPTLPIETTDDPATGRPLARRRVNSHGVKCWRQVLHVSSRCSLPLDKPMIEPAPHSVVTSHTFDSACLRRTLLLLALLQVRCMSFSTCRFTSTSCTSRRALIRRGVSARCRPATGAAQCHAVCAHVVAACVRFAMRHITARESASVPRGMVGIGSRVWPVAQQRTCAYPPTPARGK